jgi:acetyl esterase/lipase
MDGVSNVHRFLQEGDATMPLDPHLQAFLEQTGLLLKPGSAPRKPAVILAEERAKTPTLPPTNELEPVAHVENRVIAGPAGDLPVRLYTPEGTGPFPILMFFQKSWCWGNLDTHEIMCRSLCRAAGCLVVTVDYRLAPEHPFPAGLEDCYAATHWMATHAAEFHGNPARIAVGGESGGGNLAAAITLMSRDRGGPALLFQLVLCPAADFQLTTASWKDYNGYMFTQEEFLIVRDFYVPHVDEQSHPYATPSQAPNLRGLPPALIITAECDPLRDGGEHYGQRLLEAGVPATISRYDGMTHGFMHLKALIPQANQALAEAIDALRTTFANADRQG